MHRLGGKLIFMDFPCSRINCDFPQWLHSANFKPKN